MATTPYIERHVISLREPGRAFHDSFLLVNGRFGAALLGGVGRERIVLNRDTFWSGGPHLHPHVPRVGSVAAVRQALRRDDHSAANELAVELQSDVYPQSFVPLGSIEWDYAPVSDDVRDYERRLDLAHAETSTSYTIGGSTVRLSAFLSAPADVLVLSTGSYRDAGGVPQFFSPHPVNSTEQILEGGDVLRVWTGRAPAHVAPDWAESADPVRYDETPIPADGLLPAGMGFAVAALTQHIGDERRTIIASSDGFRGRRSPVSADVEAIAAHAISLVETAGRRATDVLRAEHATDYAQFFDRVDLRLWEDSHRSRASAVSAGAAELFFDLGRYLLISSSRPGTQPANLQGIWNDDPRPAWTSGFTTNINVQMNYWAAESAGLHDLVEPLTSWIGDVAQFGELTARNVYDAPGWTMHHNSDLWGYTEAVAGEPRWSNWSSAGLWLTAHLAERYAYGRDAAFATNVLWPPLAGAVEFGLSMLEPYDDGALVASPSSSPEHRFVDRGRLVALTRGATLDQELLAESLSLIVQLEADGMTPDTPYARALAERASTALTALRRPVIGEAGALLEWDRDFDPEDRGHRHVSHLYGLFPGSSIDELIEPERFGAVRAALQDRIENGAGRTGWSQSWILCLAARLRDADLVARSLQILVHDLTSPSLLDLHPFETDPSGFVFQIDGNFGAAAGILEAIVQSQRNVIRLLNALPLEWANGDLSGARARGGYAVDVSWRKGRLSVARIRAEHDGETQICLPTGAVTLDFVEKADSTKTRNIAVARTDAPLGRDRFVWQARAGSILEISPTES